MKDEKTGGAEGEKTKIRSFRDLRVWQLGMRIAKAVYEATRSFPKEELYGLVAQMRKAAVSVPSNVAEGFNRYHNAEYRQFLFIALGSCGELETQAELSFELGFLAGKGRDQLVADLGNEAGMLRNLVKRIDQRGR